MNTTAKLRAAVAIAAASALGAIAALSPACASQSDPSNDPCARAITRIQAECPNVMVFVDGGTNTNCTGSAACAADCIYTTPCDDISKNTKVFTDCLDACKQQ